jgi:two-component system response regulator RpaA
LIVEDDADIRELVAAYLEAEGFRVEQAENGTRALEVLPLLQQPTLILADLMMPQMDGFGLVDALRQDDRFATLPVVILTAAEVSVEGYRMLKKPVDLDDLGQIVKELCRGRE